MVHPVEFASFPQVNSSARRKCLQQRTAGSHLGRGLAGDRIGDAASCLAGAALAAGRDGAAGPARNGPLLLPRADDTGAVARLVADDKGADAPPAASSAASCCTTTGPPARWTSSAGAPLATPAATRAAREADAGRAPPTLCGFSIVCVKPAARPPCSMRSANGSARADAGAVPRPLAARAPESRSREEITREPAADRPVPTPRLPPLLASRPSAPRRREAAGGASAYTPARPPAGGASAIPSSSSSSSSSSK